MSRRVTLIIFILIFVASCTCTPVFFELFESSTQSDVISDYRHNKRADSNADHADLMRPKESHVEFYAEIIGKLLGSVRSGIRTFIDDVKKGRRDKNHDSDDQMDKNENSSVENQFDNSTLKMDVMQPRSSINFNHDLPEDKNEFEDFTNLINGDNRHHRYLRIFNEVMISILTSIANRHNLTNSVDTESCRNLVKDHASLLEAIKIYKKERNSKYQQKAKMTLQRIFYKYARIYLIARKSYKDYQSSHRDFLRKNEEAEELEKESMDMLNRLNFTTNDASRHSFNSIESIAILLLEIFGAMFALTLGLWTHLEHLDWTHFE